MTTDQVTTDRVSVVVPAWNAERFIEEALRSIVEQTIRPAEIIVVDDGSTDATARRAGSFHRSVTVISREHAGIGPARTVGVAASTSELVAFLDADDLWLPDKLERQLALLDADAATDAVFSQIDEFHDAVDVPPVGVRPPHRAVAAPLASAALIRRDRLDRLGPFVTTAVGEWVWWWSRARAHGVREEFVPHVLVRRRLHSHNNSHVRHDGGQTFMAIARAHRRAVEDRGAPG